MERRDSSDNDSRDLNGLVIDDEVDDLLDLDLVERTEQPQASTNDIEDTSSYSSESTSSMTSPSSDISVQENIPQPSHTPATYADISTTSAETAADAAAPSTSSPERPAAAILRTTEDDCRVGTLELEDNGVDDDEGFLLASGDVTITVPILRPVPLYPVLPSAPQEELDTADLMQDTDLS